MKRSTQQLLAFIFGVAFLLMLVGLAWKLPDPTSFQYTVLRVILALAAAGAAAMIPGFLQVQFSQWLRAGGALAVFAIVFFYNPPLPLHRSLVPPLDAEVTLDAGTFDAVELVGTLSGLTGGVMMDAALAEKLRGKPVRIDAPLKDVPLRGVLDLVFTQLKVQVEYQTEDDTVFVRERGGKL